MSIQQTTFQSRPLHYQRLLVTDIRRLPKLGIQKADSFQAQTNKDIKRNKKRALMQQIFTLTTFGIVGLYIAHRKDLFNPIRRAVKKLLKSSDFRTKIKDYTNERNLDVLYPQTIKRYLESLSNAQDKDAALKKEAKAILVDNKRLDELLSKINKKSLEEKLTPDEVKDGFFYDLMEKIKVKAEHDLNKNKNNNMPYKDRCAAWVEEQFAQNGDKPRLIDELFNDVVQGRISDDVDKFINEAIIKAKLNPTS